MDARSQGKIGRLIRTKGGRRGNAWVAGVNERQREGVA